MTEDYLVQGITAVKAGNKQEARRLLGAAIRAAPNDERTWGWFYTVCINDEERIRCLKEVLRINPNNQPVKAKYDELLGLASPATPFSQVPSPQPQSAQPTPPQSPPPQSDSTEPSGIKKSGKKITIIACAVIAVVLLCLFCLVVIILGSTNRKATPTAVNTLLQGSPPTLVKNITLPTTTIILTNTPFQEDTITPTPFPTNTPQPKTTQPPPTPTQSPTETQLPTATTYSNVIPPGTYLVGKDIQPGLYRGQAGMDIFSSCYWERLKDFSGSLDSIVANENSIGQFYVQVSESDMVLQTDCKLVFLPSLPEPVSTFPQTILPGMYLVGIDIQPGLYQGQAGTDIFDSCYWERLMDLSNSLDSIIANDNSVGQFYIQVNPADKALLTGCELTRVGN
jgi:hypothetical protein